MTKDELNKLIADGKTLDDVISDFEIDNGNIISRDSLKDFAIYQIEEDRLFLARHILDSIDNTYADDKGEHTEWYSYDTTMGTLETPIAITSIDDLYDYVED